jgi:hypothetical protein
VREKSDREQRARWYAEGPEHGLAHPIFAWVCAIETSRRGFRSVSLDRGSESSAGRFDQEQTIFLVPTLDQVLRCRTDTIFGIIDFLPIIHGFEDWDDSIRAENETS